MTMLVKFDSNVAGRMLMFADAASGLLRVAGKECTARGVIRAEEVPEIVARLRRLVEAERSANAGREGDEATDPDPIGLGLRAQPFIRFLEQTARKAEGFVLWEAPADFGKPAG